MSEKLKSISYEIIPDWGFVFHRSFTTPADKDFYYHRIWDYLYRLHYRTSPNNPDIFLRGSPEAPSWSTSPLTLPTQVKVILKAAVLDYNTDVEVEMRVSTVGWKWSRINPDFWGAELDGLQPTIAKGARNIQPVLRVQNRIMFPLRLMLAMPLIIMGGLLALLSLGIFLVCGLTPFC